MILFISNTYYMAHITIYSEMTGIYVEGSVWENSFIELLGM